MTIREEAMYQLKLEATIQRIKPSLMREHFGLEDCINQLCAALIIEYFQSVPTFQKDQTVSVEMLQQRLAVLPKYQRMLSFYLMVLENQGLVKIDGRQVQPQPGLFEFNDSDFYLEKVRIMYPNFAFFLTFVSQCAKKYHEVLTGQLPGASVLFPAGDTQKLERLYKNTPKLGYEEAMLHMLKAVVHDKIQEKGTIRVLEVGAGQGILTNLLPPLVGNGIEHYCFSDIAKSFVDQAQRRLTKPEYHFATFDCSQDFSHSSPELSAFDIIVGFNVVHATADIAQTLRHLSAALNPSGQMLFVENIKQEIWIDMLYGLVDGWWSFDDEYRTTSPLLNLSQWNDLLAKEAYSHFEVLPNSPDQDQYETGLIAIQA